MINQILFEQNNSHKTMCTIERSANLWTTMALSLSTWVSAQ